MLQSSLGALEHLVSGADGNILSREEGVAEGANSRGAIPPILLGDHRFNLSDSLLLVVASTIGP